MQIVLQDLRNGDTKVDVVPAPKPGPGELLIATRRTLVSAGTERMLIDFGKANWIDKARQQPDKVKQVLQKVRTDGLAPTVRAVQNKLNEPLAMGYCNAGEVIDLGAGVHDFRVGDRVASNGNHAELVCVPQNLCAKIPDNVDDDAAAFTVIGAIALQGIRLVQPTLGETIVVTGLGLIGLLTVQLLRGMGCQVIGIDVDPRKTALARGFGAIVVDLSSGEDPIKVAEALTAGRGVDGVVITASTKSNEPVHQAATMCRKRGRIVLVGVVGLELSRADFYEKELSFQVSCSYGPGRYDPNYELHGQDYPFGFVRWTEQRNFEAVLKTLSDGTVHVGGLISRHFPVAEAANAYQSLDTDALTLGVILDYDAPAQARLTDTFPITTVENSKDKPVIGYVGAGNYAAQTLIPAFVETPCVSSVVCSAGGTSSMRVARKWGIAEATTDIARVIANPDIDAVVIATRHNTHAELTRQALAAGQHVFVEKPLAISREELASVADLYAGLAARPIVAVGFNRRFAPHVIRLKQLLASRPEPAAFTMTINAGAIPLDHWTQDPEIGGGRIIGECCHFVDLLRYLEGAPISDVHAEALPGAGDTVVASLGFDNGSVGAIHYLANGAKAVAKERLEIFCGGSVIQLDNFRRMKGFDWSGFSSQSLSNQDKGNKACAAAFVNALRSGSAAPIPFAELLEVHERTFDIAEQIQG
ncbi:MAG: bi-domain-containing oxidoreductase [Pseudomonadota bacterium]